MMWPRNLPELLAREAAGRIALEYPRQAAEASRRPGRSSGPAGGKR